MTKIKLCGLRRMEDILCANKLLPDYVGFVFAPSKRRVSEADAAALRKALNPAIRAVGVFVNEDAHHVAHLVKEGIIDIPQLHGDEDDAYIQQLKSCTSTPVIKALRVKDVLPAHLPEADYLLFDTLSSVGRGGTGETFDWSALSGYTRPCFLAGGLHAGNIVQAIRAVHPYCVDISSGIETGGVKDPEKMEEIVGIIRSMS